MKRRTFLSRIGQGVLAAGAVVLGVFGQRGTVIETPEMSMDEARMHGRFYIDEMYTRHGMVIRRTRTQYGDILTPERYPRPFWKIVDIKHNE